MIVRDTYPIPRMDVFVGSFEVATVLMTLDCSSEFWQVPVVAEYIPKKNFT